MRDHSQRMQPVTMTYMVSCVAACEQLVVDRMGTFDCSHDVSHVWRVRSLALKLARSTSNTNIFIVEVAALLHDLYDHKYDDNKLSAAEQGNSLISFLRRQKVPLHEAEKIVDVTQLVGYSKELEREKAGQDISDELLNEYSCVQDADYLDAIGAIGILRTSAFAGARGTRLHVAECDAVANAQLQQAYDKSCAVHFQDKLLRLRDRMRTPEGLRLAMIRHEYMHGFLKQWELELIDSS